MVRVVSPALVFLFLATPSSTSATADAGHGGPVSSFCTTGGAGRSLPSNKRSSLALGRSQAPARNHRCSETQQEMEMMDHHEYTSSSSDAINGRVDAFQPSAFALRGGAGNDEEEPSVMTLFMRVLVPGFRRDKRPDGGLDLEGGGLMRRLKRLVSGVLRKVTGSSGSSEPKGEEETAATKKTGKGKKGKGAATSSHLEKTYRPGNANYRIQKELKEFMANPPDCCKVSVGKNIRVWIITISGAEGTIYAGEKFRLRVSFPEDYPTKPPALYFLQSPPPPKHQHIYTNGDICLSLLSARDWKPNLTVMSLALSILSMLSSAKEKRIPEDNAAHAEARPGQAQQWIYHDDLC
ncbi:unnamed protein product [Scytosiphon promiscuus]